MNDESRYFTDQDIARVTVTPYRIFETCISVRLVSKKKGFMLICKKYLTKGSEPKVDLEKRKKRELRWQVNLRKKQAEKILAPLKEASVPVWPDYMPGLDGAEYKLEMLTGYGATFRWWSVSPQGYEPLTAFADELLYLSGHYDKPELLP